MLPCVPFRFDGRKGFGAELVIASLLFADDKTRYMSQQSRCWPAIFWWAFTNIRRTLWTMVSSTIVSLEVEDVDYYSESLI